MNSKKIVLIFFGLLICIVAVGLFIYPGIYQYESLERGDETTPIKINRFTGKAEAYTLSGWRDLGETKTSPAK